MKKRTLKQKHKNNNLVILIIVFLLVLGLLWYVMHSKNQSVTQTAVNPCLEHSTGSATVTITSQGLTPSTVMVCRGEGVSFMNQDSVSHKLSSTSKGLSSAVLNGIDEIESFETVTVPFDTAGTITYHADSFEGKIIVN